MTEIMIMNIIILYTPKVVLHYQIKFCYHLYTSIKITIEVLNVLKSSRICLD
jgi:hypothetical protein